MEIQKDPQFREIVTKLKTEFSPKKLFLFGSHASGTAHKHSDYDFVVVVQKTAKTRIENLIRATELFRDSSISVDAFVYPEEEFNEWKDEFNSIPEIAVHMGIEVDLESF